MKLEFDVQLASAYTSSSQRARILTESWVHANAYCPNCGCVTLNKYPNNRPVGDFYCSQCSEDFELKSQKNRLSRKVVDGAYQTMTERLRNNEIPNFFALTYDVNRNRVYDLFVIPSHFFSPAVIERRKPLSDGARRSGWTGCNILLERIPKSGRVSVVEKGVQAPKEAVLSAWKRMLFLRDQPVLEARGWLLDVLKCIEKLNRMEFSLADVYQYESDLQELHPNNRNIRPKMRQQLQVLRDAGYLEFLGHGSYRVTR